MIEETPLNALRLNVKKLEREQFEAWATDWRRLGDMEMLFAWEAWKASALVEREACASLMSDASLEATAERYERFARYSAECAEIIRARSNVELTGA